MRNLANQGGRTNGEAVFSAAHLRADAVMVRATAMLDVLIAIKIELLAAQPLEMNEALELHRRLKGASDTIEAAIGQLKALAGLPTTSSEEAAATESFAQRG